MNRHLIEAGMAAMIFFAANTVYGVDALMGNNLSSARDFATTVSKSPDNLQVRIGELAAMKMPAPYSLEMNGPGLFEHRLCLESSRGSYPARVRVAQPDRELRSASTSLPYRLSVQEEPVRIGRCDDSGNVRVTIAIDQKLESLFSEGVFTDTVTLVVDPE